MPIHETDSVVCNLVDAVCGDGPGRERTRYMLRESLFGLVRLAQVEQLAALRLGRERAAGAAAMSRQSRMARALLRKIGMDVKSGQRRFEF
jgi:hypothetical protein